MTTHVMKTNDSGFSLVETIVSLGLLTTSLLSLVAVFGHGMKTIGGSSGDLIMTQKATEAIESVFTARDTGVLGWNEICNISASGACSGGVFLVGPQAVKDPGPDGLVNTSDDASVETGILPGHDNLLGTADDETTTLDAYTREIEITELSAGLRQVRVIVTYNDGGRIRDFILITFVSTYA